MLHRALPLVPALVLLISSAVFAAPADFRVETVADGLKNPWALDFLPGGDLVVTERGGGVRLIRKGRLETQSVGGLPPVLVRGQGGLMGVAAHPDFARNQWLYVCFATGDAEGNASTVVRGRLDGFMLRDTKTIFTATPRKKLPMHYGCQLRFGPGGKLFVTLGDGYEHAYQAQSLDNHFGKVLRLNEDGSVPADNPYAKRWKALPEIWSYGHRNVQGLAWRAGTDEMWTSEHGPKGGDEVNREAPGANFGWPMVTWGVDYSGQTIATQQTGAGYTDPMAYWVPSIGVAGIDFYAGERFPAWRGDLFAGALRATHLRRIDLEGDKVVGQEDLLKDLGKRIRGVRSGPDGYLYLVTDQSPGQVLRLVPR
jgi:glucose/arabinose dehydrogenase